jgi:hypothetical protein
LALCWERPDRQPNAFDDKILWRSSLLFPLVAADKINAVATKAKVVAKVDRIPAFSAIDKISAGRGAEALSSRAVDHNVLQR